MQLPETAKQERQKAAHYQHYRRQTAWYRPSRLKRRSPRNNIPSLPADQATFQRAVMEHRDRLNDFAYLFRLTKEPVVTYVWITAQQHRVPTANSTFPTLPAAIIALHSEGWEDASW